MQPLFIWAFYLWSCWHTLIYRDKWQLSCGECTVIKIYVFQYLISLFLHSPVILYRVCDNLSYHCCYGS